LTFLLNAPSFNRVHSFVVTHTHNTYVYTSSMTVLPSSFLNQINRGWGESTISQQAAEKS
jgi:hypothetical protein